MFIIPVGDENEPVRVPYVHYVIMAANIGVYLYCLSQAAYDPMIVKYGYYPAHPTVISALTSMFMHGGFWHLFGNMLFLWITGDNVEDRFGHIGYLLFYLAGGALAIFAHDHITVGEGRLIPLIGASGAISAVLGAYVALFPKAKIKYWFIIWLIIPIYKFNFRLSAYVAFGFWFLGQYFSQLLVGGSGTEVAYAAHVGGFLVGAIVTLSLILAGVMRADWGKVAVQHASRSSGALERGGSGTATHQADEIVCCPCPACQVAMRPFRLFAMEIRECRDCGGLWLIEGQTQAILAMPQVPYSVLHAPAEHPDRSRVPEGQRKCPDCHRGLEVASVEGVTLDGCPQCKGVFAERGELEALLKKV